MAIPAFYLIRCGNDSDSQKGIDNEVNPVPACTENATLNYSNPGHAHTINPLTQEEIAMAEPGDYTLMGGNHTHTFSLTADDFRDLQNGNQLSLTDNEGHGHIVSVTC